MRSDRELLDGYEQLVRECRGMKGIFLATGGSGFIAGELPFDVSAMVEHGLEPIGEPKKSLRLVLNEMLDRAAGLRMEAAQ